MSQLEPVTLTARPRRFEPPLLILAAVSTAGFVIGLAVLPWLTAAMAGGLLIEMVRPVRDRLTVGPDGIAGRYLLRRFDIAWPDVWGLTERVGILHRRVVLTRQGKRTRLLPALRGPRKGSPAYESAIDELSRRAVAAGTTPVGRATRAHRWTGRVVPIATIALCLGALTVDQPWYWVAGAEAATPPDPCAVLRAALDLDEVAPTSPPDLNAAHRSAGCAGSSADHAARLYYTVFGRKELISGAGVAAGRYLSVEQALHANAEARAVAVERGPGTLRIWLQSDVPDGVTTLSSIDLADEALFITTSQGSLSVVARRANVLVIVNYAVPGRSDTPAEAVLALARQAIDALVLA